MRFHFDERKTAQAAAHILRRHGGRLHYITLIKVLYLVDRELLLHHGMPLTGDSLVAMPKGPVLSMVLNLIHDERPEGRSSPWFEYISEPSHYQVQALSENPDSDELSDYEVQVLDQVDDQYGKMDRWALVELCHQLPEWTDPNGSSTPIEPVDILRAEGISPTAIRQMTQEAEEIWLLQALGRQCQQPRL